MLRADQSLHPAAPPLVHSGLPLFGPALRLGRDPQRFLPECQRRYGDVFSINLLLYRATFLLGEEGLSRFFRAKDDELDFNSAVDQFTTGVLGGDLYGGLLPKELERAYRLLRKGFMKEEAVQRYRKHIHSEAALACADWAKSDTIDLFPAVSRLVTRINLRSFFGAEAIVSHGDTLARSYYEVESHGTTPMAMFFPRLPLRAVRKAKAARGRIAEILATLVAQRKAAPASADDYLQLWLDDVAPDGSRASVEQILRHLLSILFAAHTNTAGTLAWIVVALLRDPVLLAHARGAEREGFLDGCIKETARLHPTPMVRRAHRPFTVGPYQIPAGDLVFASLLGVHNDPTHYPAPQSFDPLRWADEDRRRDLISRNLFVQFGYGPHRCLGEAFATTVIKTCLVHLLDGYELSLRSPDPRPDWSKALGTPFADGPVFVAIKSR